MKHLISFALVLVVLLFATSSMFAQVHDGATIGGTIVTAIGIDKISDMNFGIMAPSGTDGTVELSTAGERTPTDVILYTENTGTVSPAIFDVTGDGNMTYAISFPTDAIEVHNTTYTMSVDDWVSSPATVAGAGQGTLSSGAQTIRVGATIHVDATQETGEYLSTTGEFEVTVNYD